MENKRIAVCFFGITRSLKHTLQNINTHVVNPARKLGEVRLYAHFFDQRCIVNPRSGECCKLDENEYKLLNLDQVTIDQPDEFLAHSDFVQVSRYGDGFGDGFNSLRNLYHQLYSLNSVTAKALEWDPNIVVFARPDLKYHDSFSRTYKDAIDNKNVIYVPNWQHWDGLNDRFAVAVDTGAIKAYGQRYRAISQYCSETQSCLHSEKLLKYALKSQKVKMINIRASRVRSNGGVAKEPFHHHRILTFHNFIAQTLSCSFNNKLLVNVMWKLQVLVYGNPYKGLKHK
ncbi:MAG: hypothetical protein COB03_02850 [Alteromonas sp.]|nr:MAG: hypothetical protein COB03_02850 [Alteromonas sp.]